MTGMLAILLFEFDPLRAFKLAVAIVIIAWIVACSTFKD